MKTTRRRLGVLLAASAASARAHDDEHPPVIARTAMIHGIAGPFAVAGYRIGEHALARLGLERGSMDLEVTHYSPLQVQWTCIVDGIQASTGVSLGKMNLKHVESAETYSLIRNRQTNVQLRFELATTFLKAHLNKPQQKLYEAGLKAAEAEEQEVFRVR
jgi:formylmethanofuran dehydrogenase subunit E